MRFCRVDLSRTNYVLNPKAYIFDIVPMDILRDIYHKYCTYKQFESFMPLLDAFVLDASNDVWGYNDSLGKPIAFSVVKRQDKENVEGIQFAWDYEDPSVRLGIASLEHECAFYKSNGYKYLYLGQVADYKSQVDGYEELGPL